MSVIFALCSECADRPDDAAVRRGLLRGGVADGCPRRRCASAGLSFLCSRANFDSGSRHMTENETTHPPLAS